MMRKTTLFLWSFLALAFGSFAQSSDLSNLRTQVVLPIENTSLRDTFNIVPESVRVLDRSSGQSLDTSLYQVEALGIRWRKSLPDSVIVTYRVLPFDLGQRILRLDTAQLLAANADSLPRLRYNPYESRDATGGLFDAKGLDYNGSFSRGISFGNSQDLVLNSSFNLQLSGKLGDGIEILAAITDENIPLQPEGNTRQLREFDRIFVQLKKGKSSLIAGDYELRRPDSYFMNYYKKLQGATFSTAFKAGEEGLLQTTASVAVSRGQFARNTIAQQEGNQGPYKLNGNAGERFIIILGGTEKVWIDGKLLERGLESDYVIDYNRGEVTFTNRNLITKDSRIIVEFEYSDQGYLRSLTAFNADYQKKRWRLHLNWFAQQDSRNSTGDQNLSDAQKFALQQAGDNPALASGIDTLSEFSAFRATYERIDSLVQCGGRDTLVQYLRLSSNAETARYTARFSLVGDGNGDYVLEETQAANERAYRWVAPDPVTCQPRGNYAPVIALIAPKQQQLLTAGAEYRFAADASVKTEVALSRNDLNRFSELDSQDDVGLAAFTSIQKDFKLGADSSGWVLGTSAGYEFVQRNFKALNPYRDPEFLRDWNIANQQGIGNAPPADEHLARAVLALRRKNLGSLEYGFGTFLRDSLYSGIRHNAALRLQRSGWELNSEASLLMADEITQRTRFFRPRVDLSKVIPKLKNWRIGLAGEREKSDRFIGNTDTLQSSSFFYDRLRLFAESAASDRGSLGLSASRRWDYAPFGETYRSLSVATEYNMTGTWQPARAVQWSGSVGYRELDVSASAPATLVPASTILGRMDFNGNFFKGAVRATTVYELSAGQEPKLEFTYVPVTPGSGTHIWLDSLYNNDGKIQSYEMELAPFQDLADYIRVSTVTDQYIRTDNVNLNYSVQIEPRAVWFAAEDYRKVLSKFSVLSSLQINRKTREAPEVDAWNPFQLAIADTALVSVSLTSRNTLFFNRADPRYDIQLGQSELRSRIVQVSGYESRSTTEYFLRSRWNPSARWSLQLGLTQGRRDSDSEFFDTRDYRISSWKLEPQLTFLPNKSFRTIVRYRFQNDRNTLGDTGETAIQNDLGIEAAYNQSAKSSLRLRASYIDIRFDGVANSPVGFALLNGLQNGQNYLWNVGLDRQLGKNLRLSLSYEGRKTGSANIVHVGRAQVTAVF